MTLRHRKRRVSRYVPNVPGERLEPRALLASNPSFDPKIRAAETRDLHGVDGAGFAVAVIDTGIDYNHSALGGGFGPGKKVAAGYDLAMDDSDPRAETWPHGTMVAGLVASESEVATGVAPGADLVALRVFGNDNFGSFDLIADALEWVIDNHDEHGITVVNLSVSDGGSYTTDPFAHDGGIGQRITRLVNELKELRIPVVTGTGNGYRGQQGVGFTAILPQTISVTGTDSADRLMGNAQRLLDGNGSATDLAAPGSGLLTTSENNGFANVDGTSFCTPLVSGAIVILQQIYRARFHELPSVDQVVEWLKAGATMIVDGDSGASIGRLDLAGSAALIPAAPVDEGDGDGSESPPPPPLPPPPPEPVEAPSPPETSAPPPPEPPAAPETPPTVPETPPSAPQPPPAEDPPIAPQPAPETEPAPNEKRKAKGPKRRFLEVMQRRRQERILARQRWRARIAESVAPRDTHH